jgi:hypothetical protein
MAMLNYQRVYDIKSVSGDHPERDRDGTNWFETDCQI